MAASIPSNTANYVDNVRSILVVVVAVVRTWVVPVHAVRTCLRSDLLYLRTHF